jgi:N-acetylglucosamine malate deacetylase 1
VAHADDETLGCGGTIVKLLRAGWRVDVTIMSDGIVRARGVEQNNRADAIRACRMLGLGAPRFLGFPDQKFDTIAMSDLSAAATVVGPPPDLIITHVDSDLNMDHRLTGEVAKIVGRPRSGPVAILGCEVPSTTFWNGSPFQANYFVDVSTELDAKIEAFGCYRNELGAYPHPWSVEGLRLLAQYHGMQSGCRFAEAFVVIRGYWGKMPGDSNTARAFAQSAALSL